MRATTSFSIAAVVALGIGCVPSGTGPKPGAAPTPVASGLTVELATKAQDRISIAIITNIERHPYPGEKVIAVLTSGERVVKNVDVAFDAVSGRAKLDLPGPGTYRVELWDEGTFLAGNTFVASLLPMLDGKRALELHQDAAPRLVASRMSQSEVVWQHWDPVDDDEAFVAEWWHDGKRAGTAGAKRSQLQREVLARVQNVERIEALGLQPAWKWMTEKFPLPDTLLRSAGRWELRIYRDDKAAIALGFDIDENGVVHGTQKQTATEGSVELEVTPAPASREAARQLAKLPHTKFEASKKFALGVTAAEARALTRSGVLRTQRLRLNALTHQMGGDPSAMGFKDDSEAKQLVSAMQKLIAQLGEPWNEDEKP
jgi:hypothetical protein